MWISRMVQVPMIWQSNMTQQVTSESYPSQYLHHLLCRGKPTVSELSQQLFWVLGLVQLLL